MADTVVEIFSIGKFSGMPCARKTLAVNTAIVVRADFFIILAQQLFYD
jgi:hypothetical protein